MQYAYHYVSPLGGILLAGDGERLCGLWFEGQKYFAAGLSPHAVEKVLPVFDLTVRWLDEYFSGRAPAFTPPLLLPGSPFRAAVYRRLLAIPYGSTATYSELARSVAAETGAVPCARAVGGAVGRNPISLIVPCHRVKGADGRLIGYAGGIAKKQFLLALELSV